MDIKKDLVGKKVLRVLNRFDLDNDEEECGLEFTDGTRVFFVATPFTTGSVDMYLRTQNEPLKR